MFDVNKGALEECPCMPPTNGAHRDANNQTLPAPCNFNLGRFRSPVILHIHPQGVGPMAAFEFSGPFPTLLKPKDVQERIHKSHWMCDYSDDIFQTLRASEMKRRHVCFRSQQVGCRPMLLKLMKDAAEKHNLARTTLHLAVYLLDCFMDNYTIRSDKLNLTAITCIMIAGKIEEADMDIPRFADLNKLVDNPYLLQEFKNVEYKVLAAFDFEMIRPTAATFAEYFANSFITLQDFHVYFNHWNNEMALNQYHHFNHEQQRRQQELCLQSGIETEYELHPIISTPCPYASYQDMLTTLSKTFFALIDVSLSYLKFTNARPSIIASSCIAAVRQMHGIFPIWTPYLVKLTECTADTISPFVEAILAIYRLHCNNERLLYLQTPNTPITSGALNSSVLCDSPESGVVLCNDMRSDDEVDDCDVEENPSDDTEEDEPYNCLEYPLLPKRRRIF